MKLALFAHLLLPGSSRIKYTIKDGIVYDAKKMLADVASMVERQKKERATKTRGPY